MPVAKRTRDNQDDIIKLSVRLGRPVTFGDLARRWATDRSYAKSIDYLADLFQTRYCSPPSRAAEGEIAPPAPLQMRREWRYPFRPPSGLGGPVPDDDAAAGAEPAKKPTAPSPHDRPAAVVPKTSMLKTPKHTAKLPKARKPARHSKQVKHASTPAHTSTSSWVSATAVEAAAPAPETADVEPAPPAEAAAQKTESAGLLPWLPTFRIAPEPLEPARLGGPLPADLEAAAKAAEQAPAGPCRVLTASYGGRKTLLIRSRSGDHVLYTALTIMDGFEKPMFDAYARTEAVGAEIVGEYSSPESALIDARVNCPDDN
ncbi:MAG: hypothetical protein QM780_09340 [Hyphomicrobium sp.]|uniref:hypothetical protein n=1 Tax=Hyphomicrobium sp. TaxID=82 RepID=UPI0039E3B930